MRTWIMLAAFLVGCGAEDKNPSPGAGDAQTGPTSDVGIAYVDAGVDDATAQDSGPELSLAETCDAACADLFVCNDAALSDGCVEVCASEGPETVSACVTPPMDCATVADCLGLEALQTEVTWTTHIQPICLQSCGGCHTTNSAGGIRVNTYADVIKSSPICYPGKTVAESMALKVRAAPTCGNQMPPGHAPKLSAEDQQLFEDWVTAGWPE